MSLGEHLVELRNRLVISAAAVLVLAIVGWFVYPWVFELLKRPFEIAANDGLPASLNFRGVGTGLNVRLQMSAYVGLLLASPVIMLQIWLFVMPGLHRNERKYAIGFFGSAIPLFFIGCAAGYWAINQLVPVLLSFTPQTDQVDQLIGYDEYLAMLVKTMLAFGIAFVMPVVMVLLNFLGIIRGRTMLKAWRWIIFVSVLFTAVMVPTPEPFTLLAMSAVIASLFFAAIVIALIHDKRHGVGKDDELDDDEVEDIGTPSDLDEDDEDGR
ncbi:twin arginine-targeting protein translocase TatC [Brachybacterium sp. P6-10-X1]|uniref:twin-arginine translocase subunit TatC n=1 Tax=Brachybacterium sp. P6-10-X1 TaxID=1903186 RepID=UPI0009717826|nr:twin-arginine translocase subunit TatC [Brachybacterium sp. P6-10-X1]APX31936.1 twin arginine-targeting protein translocase TatC [Brachybacterium sp. P6-10-X1]